jgi:hypothetical protein
VLARRTIRPLQLAVGVQKRKQSLGFMVWLLTLLSTKRRRNARGPFGEESELRTRLIRRGQLNAVLAQHRSMKRKRNSPMKKITIQNVNVLVLHLSKCVFSLLAIRDGSATLLRKTLIR